jgi:glycosyltransferase involved in cell wall biosynthesis
MHRTTPQPLRKLSIIIPVYNEQDTITKVLDRIEAVNLIHGIQKEIIIVNDCSTDATDLYILNYKVRHPDQDIRYFRHEHNRGKGAAIHTGIAAATGEYLLIQDADLEYDPSEFNTLIKPIVQGNADAVYGSRFMGGNPHRVLFFWHSIGNRVLTFLSNMLNNLNLTDMETGYKVFRTGIIQRIYLQEKRFGFEPEVTAKLSQFPGIRIFEVGIAYYGRTYAEGKKIGWRDGFRTIFCILKYGLFNNPVIITDGEPTRKIIIERPAKPSIIANL